MLIAIMDQNCAERHTRVINLHSNPVGYPYIHFQIKVKRRGSDKLNNSTNGTTGKESLNSSLQHSTFPSPSYKKQSEEKMHELDFVHLGSCGSAFMNLIQSIFIKD